MPVLERRQGNRAGDVRQAQRDPVRNARSPRPIAVLSGPSHAEEIARGLPASVVVASDDEALGIRVQDSR